MATINMHQAKSELSDLVARAEAGEEIVIARRNKPAVKLVPVESPDKAAAGFAEDKQAEFDLKGFHEALEAGRAFTIVRDGKPVAQVVPTIEKKPRVPGRFAHLRGNLPPDLFDQPLTDDELAAWEGEYSASEDR